MSGCNLSEGSPHLWCMFCMRWACALHTQHELPPDLCGKTSYFQPAQLSADCCDTPSVVYSPRLISFQAWTIPHVPTERLLYLLTYPSISPPPLSHCLSLYIFKHLSPSSPSSILPVLALHLSGHADGHAHVTESRKGPIVNSRKARAPPMLP